MKKYRTIVVDPPWAYAQKWSGGRELSSRFFKGGTDRGAACMYDVMDQPAMLALPLADYAEDNAHMYLWTTMTDDHAARLLDDVMICVVFADGMTAGEVKARVNRLLRYTAAQARVEALKQWRKDQRFYMFADVIGQAEAELAAIIAEGGQA